MGVKMDEVRQKLQGYKGDVAGELTTEVIAPASPVGGQMTKAEIWEKITVTPKAGVRSKKIQVLVDEELFRKVQAASKAKGTTASSLVFLLLKEMFGDYEPK